MDSCKEKLDKFCYICGKFTMQDRRRRISELDKEIYEFYFGMSFFQKVNWAPDSICTVCQNALHDWWSQKRASMPFASPHHMMMIIQYQIILTK